MILVNRTTVFLLFIFSILILLVATNIKEFNVWNQIIEGYSKDASFISYFDNIVSHTLRILLMIPILKMAEYFNVEYNLVFSYFSILLIYLIVKILIRIQRNLNFPMALVSLSIILIVSTTFLMNGRNLFSFLGMGILTELYFKYSTSKTSNFKLISNLVLGVLLCSVSSGTFSVAFISILIFLISYVIYKLPFISLKSLQLGGFLLLLLAIFFPFLTAGIVKNLKYYNGSIIDMLSHGYGRYFNNMPIIILIIISTILFTPYFILYLKKLFNYNLNYLPIFTILMACIIGGAFGFSSFFCGYVLFLITLNQIIIEFYKATKQVSK